jgi:signal transduction histidine kinase
MRRGSTIAAIFRLADWFVPESLRQSAPLRRRAHMFVIACLLPPPLTLLSDIPFYLLDPGSKLVFWILRFGFFAVYLYPVILRRTGALETLTAIDINHSMLLFLLGAAKYGGVNSPFLMAASFLPLVAAFAIHDRKRRAVALVGIAIQGGIFCALEFSGYGLPQSMPLDMFTPVTILTVLLVSGFVWMMSAYYAGLVAMQEVTLAREIADHRETTSRLRRAMEEAQRAQALEAQLRQSQRVEALGTLAGEIAHDINNALVPVIALTALVAKQFPAASREKHNLDLVLSGAERSRQLIKRVLAYSRKEDRRCERFDLSALLQDALGMMRASLPSTIRLDRDIAAACLFEGDPTQLHQVIVNLVTNAAQAIGDAIGTIAVRLTRQADGRLLLSVADTGCGMDEATRARVFEPFFTTRAVGTGTGLGLAVVQGIVQDHDGEIRVESAPGRGSRFKILLPACALETGAQPPLVAAESAP